MADTFETLLLLALPASGKSEIRKYLDGVDSATRVRDFRLGPTLQLDDFPYVHLMRCVDEHAIRGGRTSIFFQAPHLPFRDPRDWLTLIELLDEDFGALDSTPPTQYRDPKGRRRDGTEIEGSGTQVGSAAELLLLRLDAARARVGAPPVMGALSPSDRASLYDALEPEARKLLTERAGRPNRQQGHTILVEFARGGPEGAAMPLPSAFGYAASLAQLAPTILDRAAILYVWVTPEESRRKNAARADPNDPGSILHHSVPIDVMRNDYGCDDIEHLMATSGKPGFVRVTVRGRAIEIPIARFDNRVDKTSFVRRPRATWTADEVQALHAGLTEALGSLFSRWAATAG